MVNVPQFISSFACDGHWWSLPLVGGLAYLAATRNLLYSKNLFSHYDYLATANGSSHSSESHCDHWIGRRSLSGHCNNLQEPSMGSFGAHLGRNVPLALDFGHTSGAQDIYSPNPRRLALNLLVRDDFKPAPTLNLLSVGFIQFQVHDWVIHGKDFRSSDPYLIPRPDDDPSGKGYVWVARSGKQDNGGDDERTRLYTNENTHWWDLSQLYGVTEEQNTQIRTFKEGKLSTNETSGNLPFSEEDDMEITGLRPNWWLGLSVVHNLYTREHNAICDMLLTHHPEWDDLRLYDTARLINAATNARIHTLDWTTNVLDNDVLRHAMTYNWKGALPDSVKKVVPDIFKKTLAKFNHNIYSVFFGFVGGPTLFASQPFSMTEEFTSIYRMHQLLPDSLRFWSATGDVKENSGIHLTDATFGKSRKIVEVQPMQDIAATFGFEKAGALTLNNFPGWLTNITNPDDGNDWIIDLATQDLVKDRERNIPRYAAFREMVHLSPIKTFADINPDPVIQARLASAYGDVRDVDLLIGCLAEQPRPQGFGFSDTTFQLFILMASRRLATDRFFTEWYNEETYTKEGMQWVESTDMRALLARHFPELDQVMPKTASAFRPWNFGLEDRQEAGEEGDGSVDNVLKQSQCESQLVLA